MKTVVIPRAGVDQNKTCPNCGTIALCDGEKTDLDGRLLAEFYACADPECGTTWWADVSG